MKSNPDFFVCLRLLSKSALFGLLFSSAILPSSVAADEAVVPAAKDLFTVHSFYNLILAPADFPLEEKASSFEDLTKLLVLQQNGISGWGDGKPLEAKQPNWTPFGFTGVTGYFKIPGTEDSITRGLEFRITFRDRTQSTVVADIDMNDNRATPEAAENRIKVSTILDKGVYKLIKVGPPQENGQAWIALKAENFSEKAAMPAVQGGVTMPPENKVDLKFTAADGQEIDTAKMRGKVILVDYWATWCGPCIAALPRLKDLYQKYHASGLEIIGVNLDEERAPMDSFLKKHPHPWPQSVSAAAGTNLLFDGFNVKGIPFFLLIDKKGIATPIDARNPNTEELIEARLKD